MLMAQASWKDAGATVASTVIESSVEGL